MIVVQFTTEKVMTYDTFKAVLIREPSPGRPKAFLSRSVDTRMKEGCREASLGFAKLRGICAAYERLCNVCRQQPQPPDSLLLCPFLKGLRPELQLVLQLSLLGSGSFAVAAYLSKVREIEVPPESADLLARFGSILASSKNYQATDGRVLQEAKVIQTRLDALENRVEA